MRNILPEAAAGAAASSGAAVPASAAERIIAAAELMQPLLEAGAPFDTGQLREAMVGAFGAGDAEGAWDWKTAYDACEVAQVMLLRRYGGALAFRSRSDQSRLAMWQRLASRIPTQTRRSEEGQSFQQFSTPLPLAFVAARAASLSVGDVVLEPSAGTGMLAIHAELAGARLLLNEYADARADILGLVFPSAAVTRHDAASIDDRLVEGAVPDVVLMNPPFSAAAHVDRPMRDVALRHVASALARLRDGGRLVAIVGANCSPEASAFRSGFERLQEQGTLIFSAAIAGKVYAKHGTTTATRLLVIDKVAANDPTCFVASRGEAPDAQTLLQWVEEELPPRSGPPAGAQPLVVPQIAASRGGQRQRGAGRGDPAAPDIGGAADELDYELVDWTSPEGQLADSIYEPYALQSLRIPLARPHPTALVQSAAMASVAPPKPSYRPHLPSRLIAEGILSDAQLESVIYAGEAHQGHLSGAWNVDDDWDSVGAASDDAEAAVHFRRGWFLGDGTGAGKGRQVAGIILDNWLKGRRRALWISKSDKLLEDAQRDWSALGQEKLLVTPLSRFKQGTPVKLGEGILFTTYATLRSQGREGKASRIEQIVEWLGRDFDGVIIFDEAHAMANAAGGKGERGDQKPSQQGRAGLRLQHALPDARIVYVSATGATTVQNLAYAQRLGLWGGTDFPFATRSEFVAAIEEGGVAAMEVLARDLKALGLYAARSLSFDGVEYELLEHALTEEQRRIYDSYAGAFQVIHNNLDAGMEAAGVTSSDHGTLNAQAKSAARSAFESTKQRFFNHLITAMQTPSVVASIKRDLEEGHAAVVQIVSTGEALQERRLADIPAEEFDDVSLDITPREYVLDYLQHSFPVQLFEPCTDGEGNLSSRPAYDGDGNPIVNREAARRRDAMIEKLASLPPVPGALDQIVQHFGAEAVAEVTGRSRRIIPKANGDGSVRFAVQNRPGSANIGETHAFMDDAKQILIFSEAGGTGRSYHADLGAKNQRRRIHYLLEAGWKADAAIQGFGRTNRTNQKQPPMFADNAEAVCRRYLSNGRREGHYWMVGDIRNSPGRSLYVRLSARGEGGGAAGKWTDAASGDHGDLLDVIAASCGHASFRETLDEARHFLSLPMPDSSPSGPKAKKAAQGSPEAARRLWAGSRPMAGTLVRFYLNARKIIDLRAGDPLRFHPHCFYRPSEDDEPGGPPAWPAMIAAVTSEDGRVTGVHRTWLDPATMDKAPVAYPRRAMGLLLGHGVRFGPAAPVMAAGEGIETLLSLREPMTAMSMIAALSAAHLAAIEFPSALRRLYVARDDDPAGAGALATLTERGDAAGVEVVPLEPERGDFNADLVLLGRDRLGRSLSRQLHPSDRHRFL